MFISFAALSIFYGAYKAGGNAPEIVVFQKDLDGKITFFPNPVSLVPFIIVVGFAAGLTSLAEYALHRANTGKETD